MPCGSSPFLIQDFIELAAVAQARQSIGARHHCWLSLRAYFALELYSKIAGQTDECQCECPHDRGNEQCSVPPNRINIRMRLCHHDDERQVRQSLEEIQASCTVDIRRIRKLPSGAAMNCLNVLALLILRPMLFSACAPCAPSDSSENSFWKYSRCISISTMPAKKPFA